MDERIWAWKDGWTHGRCVGFIPYSWFHKDLSGNGLVEKEVLFFQDFGLGTPASFGESRPEITEGDIYDVLNGIGPYWDLQNLPGCAVLRDYERSATERRSFAICVLKKCGFKLMP